MMTTPTVHIIVPTFREPEHICSLIQDLTNQQFQQFVAYIVNCSPGDQTTEVIESNTDPRFIELEGQASMFWTGAIEVGQRHVATICELSDFVLLMNCDIRLEDRHLDEQLESMSRNPRSMVCPTTATNERYLSSGCRITSWLLGTAKHFFRGPLSVEPLSAEDFIPVDMLAGRSLMAPASVLIDVGFVNTKKLPHYAADYEYSARVKRAGYDLFVAAHYQIVNDDKNSGVKGDSKESTFAQRFHGLFSIRSPFNLKYRTRFVFLTYPWYAIPTGLLANFAKVLSEIIFGNFLKKRPSK